MCGIAGFSLSPYESVNANALARQLLLGIEHRGRDATGAAWRNGPDSITVQKRDVKASEWVSSCSLPRAAMTAVLHTRAWTQGHPTNNNNNHPIRSGSLVGVHNGTVWNDDWLRSIVPQAPRIGEVDSEAIFALLAYDNEENVKLLEMVEGFAAIAYMDLDDGEYTLHLARLASSPLVIAQTDRGSLLFASERKGLLHAADLAGMDIKYLDDLQEGTYLRVESGLIVDEQTFEVDHWSSWKSSKSTKPKATTTGTAPVRSLNQVVDEDYYEWCDPCSNRRYECDDTCPRALEEQTSRSLNEVEWDVAGTTFIEAKYLNINTPVPPVSEEDWAMYYKNRHPDIEEWLEAIEQLDVADEVRQLTVYRAQAFVRPGDWVRTTVFNQEFFGQVVEVPDEFPGGNYVLRVLVPRSGGDAFEGMEPVIVSRPGAKFTAVNNKPAEVRTTDQLEGAAV